MGSITHEMDSQRESKEFLLLLITKNLETYLSVKAAKHLKGKALTDRYAPEKRANKSNKN